MITKQQFYKSCLALLVALASVLAGCMHRKPLVTKRIAMCQPTVMIPVIESAPTITIWVHGTKLPLNEIQNAYSNPQGLHKAADITGKLKTINSLTASMLMQSDPV